MTQQDFPCCKFRFFCTMVSLVWGGGGGWSSYCGNNLRKHRPARSSFPATRCHQTTSHVCIMALRSCGACHWEIVVLNQNVSLVLMEMWGLVTGTECGPLQVVCIAPMQRINESCIPAHAQPRHSTGCFGQTGSHGADRCHSCGAAQCPERKLCSIWLQLQKSF